MKTIKKTINESNTSKRQVHIENLGRVPVRHVNVELVTNLVSKAPATMIGLPAAPGTPINVTILPNVATGVTISVYFQGPSQNQLVTVVNGASWQFPSSAAPGWNCVTFAPSNIRQTIIITAVVDKTANPPTLYSEVVNNSIWNGQYFLGIDVSNFSMTDGSLNNVYIVIQDGAVATP